MNSHGARTPHKAPPYKPYKDGIFTTAKDKVKMTLNGIKHTSLRPDDKEKLVKEIKELVANY